MSARARFILGVALVLGGNLLFFTSFWIWWMPWSISVKTTVSGIFFFAPETLTLVGIAIMGKENYEHMLHLFTSFIRKIKPACNINPQRHKIGLALFFLPLIPTYIQAYHPQWLPDSTSLRVYVRIAVDVLFVASLFVLGGDFWDKLYALFVGEARAQPLPSRADHSSGQETESS